jgi:hypothetical protein
VEIGTPIDRVRKLCINAYIYRQVDKVLVNKASVAITDIIRTWDNSHKVNIVKRLIQSLK